MFQAFSNYVSCICSFVLLCLLFYDICLTNLLHGNKKKLHFSLMTLHAKDKIIGFIVITNEVTGINYVLVNLGLQKKHSSCLFSSYFSNSYKLFVCFDADVK